MKFIPIPPVLEGVFPEPNSELKKCRETCQDLGLRNTELSAEIERLREALEYYADRRRYDNTVAINRGDGSYDYSTEILEDEGAFARAVLAGDK